MTLWCWHRPGRLRKGVRTCRHCGVAIVECPGEDTKRKDPPCRCCDGSQWVAVVRSRVATVRQAVAE